jgi:hypothetical protein
MRNPRPSRPRLAILLVAAAVAAGASPGPWRLSAEGRRILDGVTADSLRGHLSFLASDTLGGRVNGTHGLDVAAEYVAAQFRRAGLEAIGDDGYFQTAPGIVATPRAEGFRFSVSAPDGTVDIPPAAFQMTRVEAIAIEGAELVKMPQGRLEGIEVIAGRAVVTEMEGTPSGPELRESLLARQRWMREVRAARPALIVMIDRRLPTSTGYFDQPALVEPSSPFRSPDLVVTTSSADLARLYAVLPSGQPAGRLTLHVPEPRRQPTPLRNVAGLLRGSDPTLAGTYVLVTAHYDGTGPHLGDTGPDRIWNGANDDGSGTVALIELASAFARLHPRPRRSILLVAFFGEEKGLVGSTYYAAHPLVPLDKTVADVNIEHIGRTDSTERDKAGTASLTGYDFSDVPRIFEAAGRETGIEVYKDVRRSDAFFAASDNYALAAAGVIAHTVTVVFEDFADYHGPGDEWPKIDFPNMERTVRMVGAAVLMMADASEEPRWRVGVEEAAPYRQAWQRLRGGT